MFTCDITRIESIAKLDFKNNNIIFMMSHISWRIDGLFKVFSSWWLSLYLNKLIFNTDYFNNNVRKHRDFQVFLNVFLFIWITVGEFASYYYKESLSQTWIAWSIRGIFYSVFSSFLNIGRSLDAVFK